MSYKEYKIKNKVVTGADLAKMELHKKMKKERRQTQKQYLAVAGIAVILLIMVGLWLNDVGKYPERHSTAANYQLMLRLNDGDEDAIEYYRSRYIANDIYLFDGPVSVGLFSEKYNLDPKQVQEDLDNYNMGLQEYYSLTQK